MPGINPDIVCYKLNVNPEAKPVKQKARKLTPYLKDVDNKEIQKLKAAGFICEVKFPYWIANIVVVKKPNRKIKVCIDFKNLNEACPKNSFPLPNIDQLAASTVGHDMISMMDMYAGYNQIQLAKEYQEKPAFTTEQGLFCFTMMLFGMKNAGTTYQCLVTKMFEENLGKIMEVYIDDMVVKSKDRRDHPADLENAFKIIRQYNIKLNPDKCAFGIQSGKFFGYMLAERGIEVDLSKIKAVLDMPIPKTKK